MSTNPTTLANKASSRRRLWMLCGTAAVLVAVVVVMTIVSGTGDDAGAQAPTFTAKEEPLTISVTVPGSIRNSDAIIMRNEVEGVSTILYIIEEGSHVEAGTLLVELDSSQHVDRQVDQEITANNSDAQHVNSVEQLEITRKKGESDIKNAEVALQLAILDLEKYLGVEAMDLFVALESKNTSPPNGLSELAAWLTKEDLASIDLGKFGEVKQGEYSQDFTQATNKIKMSEEEMKRAETKYTGSQRLEEKGYISQTELDADRLEFDRRRLELEVAQSELELLVKYTKRRKIAELISEVEKKAFGLTKAEHEAQSNVRDAIASRDAKFLANKREKEKLEKLIDQIGKCKLNAPQAGMVVYGEKRSPWEEPLKQGMQVYQQQELMRLPKPGAMIAEVKVAESMVERVREGLPVILSFDALSGSEFRGAVKRVSIVPDEEDRWMNPDAKTYQVEISIDEGDVKKLKPGMSCSAEIIVQHYDKTVFVPIQSVFQVDGSPTVQVLRTDGTHESRAVETGLDNNRMISIASGLAAGEEVLLSPELRPAEKPHETKLPDALADAANAISKEKKAPSNASSAAPTAGEQGEPKAKPTEEQMKAMRERFLAMIPEDQREKVKNMSDEERAKWFQTEEGRKVFAKLRESSGGGSRGEGEGVQGQASEGTSEGTTTVPAPTPTSTTGGGS